MDVRGWERQTTGGLWGQTNDTHRHTHIKDIEPSEHRLSAGICVHLCLYVCSLCLLPAYLWQVSRADIDFEVCLECGVRKITLQPPPIKESRVWMNVRCVERADVQNRPYLMTTTAEASRGRLDENADVNPYSYRVYWSGNKGCTILVETRTF